MELSIEQMVFGTSGVDLEVSGDGVWWMKSYELWTCIPTILGSLGNCQSHFTHSTDLSSIFNSEDATSPKAERYWKVRPWRKVSDLAWRVSWSHDAAIENPLDADMIHMISSTISECLDLVIILVPYHDRTNSNTWEPRPKAKAPSTWDVWTRQGRPVVHNNLRLSITEVDAVWTSPMHA